MVGTIDAVADAGDEGVGEIMLGHDDLEVPAFEVVVGAAPALEAGRVEGGGAAQ